jgi:hypothetical protein
VRDLIGPQLFQGCAEALPHRLSPTAFLLLWLAMMNPLGMAGISIFNSQFQIPYRWRILVQADHGEFSLANSAHWLASSGKAGAICST